VTAARTALLLAGLLVLLTGCPGRTRLPLAWQNVSAQDLVAHVAQRRDKLTSLRARARLRSGFAGMWTRKAVLVERPDRVRIDVLSPFGLAMALGAHDSRLWVYPVNEAVVYEGPADSQQLARFLGAPLSLPDLVNILLGVPPVRQPSAAPRLERTDDGRYRLTLPLADGAQVLGFAPDTLDLRTVEEVRGGNVVLRVAFDDYDQGFARSVEVSAPLIGASARVAYDAVEQNPALDPRLFDPPAVPKVLPLEAVTSS
jgi:hypothetical protein